MKMKCGCEIKEACVPPDSSNCKVHKEKKYPLKRMHCRDYRPQTVPNGQWWPRCICGEISQEHGE